jgi:hypothetical protein
MTIGRKTSFRANTEGMPPYVCHVPAPTQPQSTTKFAPVIALASEERRKKAAFAISSGSRSRPRGVALTKDDTFRSLRLTASTSAHVLVMPWGNRVHPNAAAAHCVASGCINDTTAALAGP